MRITLDIYNWKRQLNRKQFKPNHVYTNDLWVYALPLPLFITTLNIIVAF